VRQRLTGLVFLLLAVWLVLLCVLRAPFVLSRALGLLSLLRQSPETVQLYGATTSVLSLLVIGGALLAGLVALRRLLPSALAVVLPGADPDVPTPLLTASGRRSLLRDGELRRVRRHKRRSQGDSELTKADLKLLKRFPGVPTSGVGLLRLLRPASKRAVLGLAGAALLWAGLPAALGRLFSFFVHPGFPVALVGASVLPLVLVVGVILVYAARRTRAEVAERSARFDLVGHPAGVMHEAETYARQTLGADRKVRIYEDEEPQIGRVRPGQAGSFAGELVFEVGVAPGGAARVWPGWLVLLSGAGLFATAVWLAFALPFDSHLVPQLQTGYLLELCARASGAILLWTAGRRLLRLGEVLLRRRILGSELYGLRQEGSWSTASAGPKDTTRKAVEIRCDVHLRAWGTRVTSEQVDEEQPRAALAAQPDSAVQATLEQLCEHLQGWQGAAGGGDADRQVPDRCACCGAPWEGRAKHCAHCGAPA